ncbi:MAG: segregation/condensation protein A [Chlamydiota bacterium]|nr:segregation/condensation protein A [Chlamydiota bacterium]
MDGQRIKLEVFEGPLDLLLYLVKRAEVEIMDIPIEKIADQYLEYLDMMKMLDLDIAGDFLVMAAQLLYIKSKMLLPPEERPQDEDEDEQLDPRSELIRQLIEYKKFKEAAFDFRQMEAKRQMFYPREVHEEDPEQEKTLNLGELSIFDLLSAFSDVLHKLEIRDNLLDLFKGEVSVEESINNINMMLEHTESVRLIDIFKRARSRMEIVASFLATLELVRLHRIRVTQDSNYGDIYIHRRKMQEISI